MTTQADGPRSTAWPDAREAAFHWATRAEAQYAQALRGSEEAARYAQVDDFARSKREQSEAGVCFERSTEAVTLAEMWAKVAAVLEPRPDPALAEAAWRAQASAQTALADAMTDGTEGASSRAASPLEDSHDDRP